jgi:hypothetical protein
VIRATYKAGNHISIQLDIALAIPVNVHIKLDPIDFGLGDVDVAELDGNVPKVDLGEVERRQRSWQHRLEHWLDYLLYHVAPVHCHVRP